MNKNFAKLIINLLGDLVLEHQEFGKSELTVEVSDVNAKVKGKGLEQFIVDGLSKNGYNSDDIKFTYGNGNWMTISLC